MTQLAIDNWRVPDNDADKRKALSQWYTPPGVAARLWDWCHVPARQNMPFRVIEPAAGDGALLRPMLVPGARCPDEVTIFEIDGARKPVLLELFDKLEAVTCPSLHMADFLAYPFEFHEFDLCLMNPPYESTAEHPVGQDVAFIGHALGCSRSVVGLFRSALVHGSKRWAELWRWTDPKRIAWLSSRPDFGGDQSAKTDFVALHLVRRTHARMQGDPWTCNVEWWT